MSPKSKHRHIRSVTTFRTLLAALIATALMGIAAGPAIAQDPTDVQYDPSSEIIESGVAGAEDDEGAVGGATSSGTGTGTGAGSLPFTGLDVALAGVVAALLIGTGLLMRRAGREQSV
jgi:hypothetical protein